MNVAIISGSRAPVTNCECVQGQSESKVGIITYASKSKVETKLESSKMRPKTKRKQIWNHPLTLIYGGSGRIQVFNLGLFQLFFQFAFGRIHSFVR
jgi:hypothetical protein